MANPRPTPKPGNLGPQTSLTRCTFPVLYPVLAPERGPEWQTHARRRNLGRVLRCRNEPRRDLPVFVDRIPPQVRESGPRRALVVLDQQRVASSALQQDHADVTDGEHVRLAGRIRADLALGEGRSPRVILAPGAARTTARSSCRIRLPTMAGAPAGNKMSLDGSLPSRDSPWCSQCSPTTLSQPSSAFKWATRSWRKRSISDRYASSARVLGTWMLRAEATGRRAETRCVAARQHSDASKQRKFSPRGMRPQIKIT